MEKRLYSDKEIGALIQRATEIQEDAKASLKQGLSLHEIEHIAAEIGIDPAHLRVAAMELESRPDPREAFHFWGGPFVLGQKRIVEGHVPEQQWEEIVQGLRRLTGSLGKVNEIGQAREWTRVVKDLDYVMEQTRVTVTPGAGQTTIEVRKHYGGGAVMAYVLGVLFSITIAGISLDGSELSELINAAILGGSGIGGLGAARTFIAFWTKRQRQKVRHLIDWLHDTVAQPASVATEKQRDARLPEFSLEEAALSIAPDSRRRTQI